MADDEALYGLLGEQLKSTSQTVPNLSGYVYMYIYTKSSRRSVPSIGISEAKLIWGVWGGGGSDSGPFGKVRPEPGWGELQK